MKKIPTVFVREYKNHKVVGIKPEFTNEECEDAFLHLTATVKVDGACCAVIGGKFYKRFDAKKGRKIPENAFPCGDPDPITGHWPHWVPVTDSPDDKYFRAAADYSGWNSNLEYGTFEAVGPHIQGNPYNLKANMLIPHGTHFVVVDRDFESVKEFLRVTPIEGIVFWNAVEPVCKIKRSDFGFEWPCEGAKL